MQVKVIRRRGGCHTELDLATLSQSRSVVQMGRSAVLRKVQSNKNVSV